MEIECTFISQVDTLKMQINKVKSLPKKPAFLTLKHTFTSFKIVINISFYFTS